MIKYILRLSIAAFIIIFTYDTINFYLARSKVPQENQLVVVRPEVKAVEEKKVFDDGSEDRWKEQPLWYAGLGAATATGVAVLCYCVSAVSSKAELIKGSPDRFEEGGQDKDGGTNPQPSGDLSTISHGDPHSADLSKTTQIDRQSVSQKDIEEKKERLQEDGRIIKSFPEDSQDFTEILLGKGEEEEEVSRSETTTALESEEISNFVPVEPSFGDYLQVEQDLKHRSYTIAENSSGQLQTTKLFDESDVILDSRLIMDCELSSKALPTDVTLVTIPEQVIAAMSCLKVTRSQPEVSSLPLTKGDLEKIELRLSNIEERVSKMEFMSKDCFKQIEIAELELVDLHEQIYTILTKLEEEQKPSYVIVSQMSMMDDTKEEVVKEVPETKDEPKKIEYHHDQENYADEKKLKQTETSEQHEMKDVAYNEEKTSELGKEENGGMYIESPLSSSKLRSVGLDAILMKEIPPKSSTAPPRKANPKVPTHYVQPYKRSSFTATDSLSDIRKDISWQNDDHCEIPLQFIPKRKEHQEIQPVMVQEVEFADAELETKPSRNTAQNQEISNKINSRNKKDQLETMENILNEIPQLLIEKRKKKKRNANRLALN